MIFETSRAPFIFLVIEISDVEGIPICSYNIMKYIINNNNYVINS